MVAAMERIYAAYQGEEDNRRVTTGIRSVVLGQLDGRPILLAGHLDGRCAYGI